MLDIRTSMKEEYKKDKYSCPHCREGTEQEVLESAKHMLSECSAYVDLRAGLNHEAVLEDRALFLRKSIKRRKELELKLKTTGSKGCQKRFPSIYLYCFVYCTFYGIFG